MAVLQLTWHGGQGTLGAVTEESAVVLTEMIMHSGMCGQVSVIQIGTREVHVLITGVPETWIQDTGMLIRGIAVGKSCFVVWSGKSAKVYRIDAQLMRIEALPTFSTSAQAIAIADSSQIVEETLFMADQGIVRIANFTGTQKGSISFSETEGVPEFVDINDKYLAVVTNKGIIGIYDVHSPKKPKPVGSAGRFQESTASSSSSSSSSSSLCVRRIRINCDGTRVAIIADQVEGALKVRRPDSKLHIYDRNKGNVNVFDFEPLKKCPISIEWDGTDNRMVACEALRARVPVSANTVAAASGGGSGSKAAGSQEGETADTDIEVYLFFATSEHGVLMQDSFARKQPFGNLLGLAVPRLFFRNAPPARRAGDDEDEERAAAEQQEVKVYSKIMRDFVGMADDIDENTKFALLDFSYNLTLGRLDEAYRAVKTIGSASLWENMAQMCIKTKRLDVAEVCLGNMGHSRGAAAVRESKKDANLEMSIGVLATHLGLYDEAARLFREANRYDMLNKLYQAAGEWEKAIKVADTSDRIHLKTTHYNYAKHLESVGDVEGAMHHYEVSENNRSEVPRMLFSLGRIDDLEDYVHKSDDQALLKWWAAYLESKGKYDSARKYYNRAGDYLSLVRICCFKGDFNKAAEIIQESGDRASAYHFARQLEAQGEYQEAINFYADSGCYNHSIRLARGFGLDAELMRFALKSTTSLMLDCAAHFEAKGELDKAVQLYHKGGDLPRALDLCFRGGESNPSQSSAMFDMLNTIAQDLGANTSPQTLARCAEFLVQHKQFEKAVELYVMAGRLSQAIDMCLQHRVSINDEMVEKLTPPESVDPNERKEILKDLARALKKQGAFTMASKKYTQAGDRVRAIKCLVKSGDTKAVIQFASISRNMEIYTLAANYLQQMNWRESIDIMKAIIQFYTKAKAFEQLAGFYDSCAQVEIDEYRDYEKAIGALKEALKYLTKVETRSAMDMTNAIEKRIMLIEKFVQARRASKKEPETMVAICEALLHEPLLEDAVRSGDCFAMLIEYYHQKGKLREAYTYLQDMEERRIPIHPYIDAVVIDEIYKAAGVNQGSRKSGGGSSSSSGGGGGESKYQGSSGGDTDRGGKGVQGPGQADRLVLDGDDDDEIVDEDIAEVTLSLLHYDSRTRILSLGIFKFYPLFLPMSFL
jgi:intraflagellar transport protein 140